jgi:hypothetical protein
MTIMGERLETDRSEAPQPELEQHELSAADALGRIRSGQTVQQARIHRLVLKGDFNQPVRLKNCTLIHLEFDSATFQNEVALVNCKVDRLLFSHRSVFQDGLNVGSSALSQATFRQITVQGSFNLGNGEAHGKLLFNQCRFEGPARFWELHAHGWMEFKDCEFMQPVDLRSMHVGQGFILQDCRFAGEVLLRGSTVSKKLDAANSRFEGLLDLGKAKLHDFVYLEGIGQGEKQRFAFLNALADRILIQPAQLLDRLASEQAGHHEQAMHEYGLLKRSFQNLHRFDQEDWAFYRFKVNQRRGCGRSWRRPWTKLGQLCNWLFLDLGCGYGTNPFRAVRAAGVIILLFALVYALGIEQFYLEKKPFPELEITDWPNRIVTSLLMSVSVFTSGLSSIRDLAKGWMNVPLIVESLLGTLLWGLFIVAFSRKVIR